MLFEGCPGLWKIVTYSTEFFIKDASLDQVREILKIGLSSKGGESIFVLYWDWLRWYAVTLGSSYVEETPTYSRGWYWLAIEQILSSGMVLVDDVDLFLAAPGFDQSTIVFLLFCLKHVCSNKIIQRAIWKPGTNSGFLPSRKGKNPERRRKKKPPLRRMGRAEGPKGREEQHPSCPRSNVTCATVKQFPAFQTTRHQLLTKPILVRSKKLSRLLSGSYFGIFVSIWGLSRFVKDCNL